MAKPGITWRKVADVLTKVATIESEFRRAVDWLANTGQGVTNEASL